MLQFWGLVRSLHDFFWRGRGVSESQRIIIFLIGVGKQIICSYFFWYKHLHLKSLHIQKNGRAFAVKSSISTQIRGLFLYLTSYSTEYVVTVLHVTSYSTEYVVSGLPLTTYSTKYMVSGLPMSSYSTKYMDFGLPKCTDSIGYLILSLPKCTNPIGYLILSLLTCTYQKKYEEVGDLSPRIQQNNMLCDSLTSHPRQKK